MSAYGIEDVVDAIETHLKANLGTKLTSINTEKGDSLLVTVNSDAYYKQFIDSEPNYDPFLVLGVLDPSVDDNAYSSVAQSYTIDVIIFFEQIDATSDFKKAFRYQRALREIITEGFSDIFKRVKIGLNGLAPVTVQISRKAQQHRATGVSLNVTLAG